MKAADELGAIHPFLVAGMTKADVRVLGALLGMPESEQAFRLLPCHKIAEQLNHNRGITFRYRAD